MTTPRPAGSRPLVSVVVPVYNGEAFLTQAIHSVLSQTYAPIEVLAVDDGSTDHSPAILAGMAGIRVIRQPNQGVAAARNAGIAASLGDFIALLDQDDVWLPGKISAQMDRLLADPVLDYALTTQQRFVEPGVEVPAWVRAGSLEKPVGGFEPSAAVIRRSAFTRIGLFDTRFIQGSDADWFFRAADAGLRFAVIPEPLLLRRVHTRNNSQFTQRSVAELRRMAFESIRRKRTGRTSAPLHDAAPVTGGISLRAKDS